MFIRSAVSSSVGSYWLWITFTAVIVLVLLLYNAFFRFSPRQMQFKEAVKISFFWIVLALLFNVWVASQLGVQYGIEFFSGYIIEKSLSLDNLLVIFMIFQAFKIPLESQHRMLFYGILGAIFMRGILIFFGSFLVAKFHWALYLFGFILMMSGIRFLMSRNKGTSIFLFKKAEKWSISPMFVALIFIEISDLVFALDSIPAVFAMTRDPFIAFTSNVFALLGLRALYFVISEMMNQVRYLKVALALILIFVGGKMMLEDVVVISNGICILVIFSVLGSAMILNPRYHKS